MSSGARRWGQLLGVVTICGFIVPGSDAATIDLVPIADNSLFSESADESGGATEFLFAGELFFLAPDVRRALVAFNVAGGVPAGSTINSATLTLHVSKSSFQNFNPQTGEIHRLLESWGEAGSGAATSGGAGAGADPGDATWAYRFWDATTPTSWSTAGGAFVVAPSASVAVPHSGDAYVTWGSTSAMVADVQNWLNAPASNFGWIVRVNETDPGSARRFDSRENTIDPAYRPKLTIDFSPPAASPAGKVPDGDDVSGTPLVLAKGLGGAVDLQWGVSCLGTDTDFAVYEGSLGAFTSHVPVVCSTTNLPMASLVPSAGNRYFIVVPRNASREGSYGRSSANVERPPSGAACLPQALAACP